MLYLKFVKLTCKQSRREPTTLCVFVSYPRFVYRKTMFNIPKALLNVRLNSVKQLFLCEQLVSERTQCLKVGDTFFDKT